MPDIKLKEMNPKIFDVLFQPNKSDDKKTAEKKHTRRIFADMAFEDDLLMSSYIGKISFLSSDKFLDRLEGLERRVGNHARLDNSTEQSVVLKIAMENWDYFQALLRRLENVYKETCLNFKDRIAFVDYIYDMHDYCEIC